MATKKPSTAKKATSTKKAPTKKATRVKTVAAPKKKAVKNQDVQSFKIAPETEPFMTFRVGRQTIYWAIFGIAVIALTLWVASLQKNINDLYDQIDAANVENMILTPEEVETYKNAADKKADDSANTNEEK